MQDERIDEKDWRGEEAERTRTKSNGTGREEGRGRQKNEEKESWLRNMEGIEQWRRFKLKDNRT